MLNHSCLQCKKEFFPYTYSDGSFSKHCSRKCQCITIGKIKGNKKGNSGAKIGCKRPDLGIRNSLSPKFGLLNSNWKGGISFILEREKIKNELGIWRQKVYERDNYTCRMCNERGGELQAHHIKKFSDYPELRLEVDNGVTLCEGCHNKTKGKEERFENLLFNK
jgi:hypothetical protein